MTTGQQQVERTLRVTDRGRWADPLFRAVLVGAGSLVLLILGLMVVTTTSDALPVLRREGIGFLTGTTWDPGTSRSGITGTYQALVFIVGTLVSSAIALVLAVPTAIGIALYLTEIAGPRIRRPLMYLVEALAAVPSVIYGLWGLHFFSPYVLKPVGDVIADTFGFIPFLSGPVINTSYFVAGSVLAIMILPIITAVSREVFAQVPDSERYAAYGLGATRWEVIRHVVLHRGRPGVIGASMIGLGRALGETIAVAMLIGGAQRLNVGLFDQGESVAAKIVNTFQEAAPENILALTALGVVLFAVTVGVNLLARVVARRLEVAA